MASTSTDVDIAPYDFRERRKKIRNLTGFWLLGLCNNYAYVIMLSAAHDVLSPKIDKNGTGLETRNTTSNHTFDCNNISTGAVLLADILPALFIKSIAPFIGISTSIRIFVVTILCAASLLTVAFSVAGWMTFLGVVFASLSSGLGETTLLSYASYFPKDVVSLWSSGTGGSGIIGALSYAVLTKPFTPQQTLLILLFVPVVLFFSFYFLLVHPIIRTPEAQYSDSQVVDTDSSSRKPLLEVTDNVTDIEISESVGETSSWDNWKLKLAIIKTLWPYAVPLMAVYFAEYFINQGLMELIIFPETWLTHKEQYRWYNVDYQLGVFLSRSSVNFFQIKYLWILPIIQFGNMIFLLVQVAHPFIHNIWIILAMVLFEGLLGGAAYVNTYYKMAQQIPAEKLPFSMAVVPLSDTVGIAIAGAIALPVHDYFCTRM